MTDWRPGADLAALRARARLLARIRAFFAARGVLEVETPILGSTCAVERHIEPLSAAHPDPARGRDGGYLQTSPELFMKRLLAAGSGPIYQCCHGFRRGESGHRHNPEFGLLEWYRPGMGCSELMDEVADLVRCGLERPDLSVRRVSYRALFDECLGLDPLDADEATLRAAVSRHGIAVVPATAATTRETWLDLLLDGVVVPQLDAGSLVFVHDFPARQAGLARVAPDDPRVAERFELFHAGLELANGYHELQDPAEQRRRFSADNAARSRDGLAALPLDERFLAALAYLPDCSGVALGVDRLLMALLGRDAIDGVQAFAVGRL